MKFSYKLSCAIAMLLAVSLSVGGYLLVRQNFNDAINNVARQNTGRHLMEKYSLESELLSLSSKDMQADNNQIIRYGTLLSEYMGDQDRWLAVFGENKEIIYSNFPEEIIGTDQSKVLDETGSTYYFHRSGSHTVMLIASKVEGGATPLWLMSGYSMTQLFIDRDNQMNNFWRMEASVLFGSAVIIIFLSSRITRPMRRLNILSRKIAMGAYNVRTDYTGSDEIGQLGRNFDKMAVAVEQKVDALNHSLQQRDDFVGAFTHEIKTPMTTIIGYSDLLRSGEYAPEVRQKAANYIYSEAKRLESLSQKLLTLMGLTDEKATFAPHQLNSIFKQAGRSSLSAMNGVIPEFKPAGNTFVICDRDLTVDILRNLMLNASRAEPKDGKVRVHWEKQNERISIMVTDTGNGIPEAELKRILEPFYMVDKSRSREVGGSGLGLSICEKIARLHSSELEIKSVIGEGTTVSFSLELYNGEDNENEET